jgi:hypothetical protein
MALTITVTLTDPPPAGHPAPATISNFGNSTVEVGSRVTLTVEGGSKPYNWTEDSGGTLLISETDKTQIAWTVRGRAFGRANIKVTDSKEGEEGILELYVGSVVVVGADDSYWQLFADGTTQRIDSKKVDPRITALVDSNAIVADITDIKQKELSSGAPPSEAVTCYMLNLASFAFDSSKKSKKNP